MLSLFTEDEIQRRGHINLAPMVDFLFLIVAVFAILSVTHTALFDSKVELVRLTHPESGAASIAIDAPYLIHVSISAEGNYTWITERAEYALKSADAIANKLLEQHRLALLPQERHKTCVLLHIDRQAPWEPIAQAILTMRRAGFTVRPVYVEAAADADAEGAETVGSTASANNSPM